MRQNPGFIRFRRWERRDSIPPCPHLDTSVEPQSRRPRQTAFILYGCGHASWHTSCYYSPVADARPHADQACGVLWVSDGCRRSMMNRDTHLPFFTALAIAIVWIILAVFLHAQDAQFHDAPPSSAHLKNPYSRQQTAVSSGSRIYATNCSSCHGSHGEGNGAMPALAHGPTQSASEGELFWFITTGAPDKGMPSWSTLPERQRWQLVTYLKSLKNSHDAQEGASASK